MLLLDIVIQIGRSKVCSGLCAPLLSGRHPEQTVVKEQILCLAPGVKMMITPPTWSSMLQLG